MNLYEKLNRLDDSLVESKRIVKKKKLTEALAANEYELTYHINTASRDRRPETTEDVLDDWRTVVFRADSDLDAWKEAFERVTGDYYGDFLDENATEDDFSSYFDDSDWGDGSPILIKLSSTETVLYDTGYTKESWIEEYVEEDDYDDDIDEMLTESVSKRALIQYLNNHSYGDELSSTEFTTLVDNLWAVIENEQSERKSYGMPYKSIEEVDVEQLIDSSDNPTHDLGYRLFGWYNSYDDDTDEMLTESEEKYELSTLVKDSINHLVNDLGKDPMADDFGDDVCADLENNYDIDVPQNMVKYADWCDAVMSEVSRQLNNKGEQLTENSNNPYLYLMATKMQLKY